MSAPPTGEEHVTSTCRTPGCVSEGQSVDLIVSWQDEDGVWQRAGSVSCGGCSNRITDLDPDYWSSP